MTSTHPYGQMEHSKNKNTNENKPIRDYSKVEVHGYIPEKSKPLVLSEGMEIFIGIVIVVILWLIFFL
jgi:hypothetical protein